MKIIAKGLSYLNLLFLMTVVTAVDSDGIPVVDSDGIPVDVIMECLILSMVLGVLLACLISLLESDERKKRRKNNGSQINRCRRRRVG